MPEKPFSRDKRHKLVSIGWNQSSSGPQFERTKKRLQRLKLYIDDIYKSDILVSDEMRKKAKLNVYYELRSKAEARDFQRQKELLKRTIKLTNIQRKIAQQKAELILGNKKNVMRFDNLARMLTEIGLDDSFQYAGATRGMEGVHLADSDLSPKSIMRYFMQSTVSKVTDWSELAKYNAVAYFDPNVFDSSYHYHDGYEWGKIKKDVKHPVMAVQVMHWDPKVLAAFTKGMLKIVPDNPIAVFDLYGNVFFP